MYQQMPTAERPQIAMPLTNGERREKAVPQSVGRLNLNVGMLEDVITVLENELGGVILPQPDVQQGELPRGPVSVPVVAPLAMDINALSQRVEFAANRIRSITGRIDA